MKIIVKNLKQVQYNVEIGSDEKTIKDVLDLVSYKHPEVKIVGRGKDYDSWNRFRNNK